MDLLGLFDYQMGVMMFEDISLDPKTGIFEAQAMAADQLTALIIEMKYVCIVILPLLEASLEIQPL